MGKFLVVKVEWNSATLLLTDWFISQQFAVALPRIEIETLGMEFCGVTLYNI